MSGDEASGQSVCGAERAAVHDHLAQQRRALGAGVDGRQPAACGGVKRGREQRRPGGLGRTLTRGHCGMGGGGRPGGLWGCAVAYGCAWRGRADL
eukprot:scaffold16900_cov105-Isochrysis_galbana.AAC.11